MKKVVFIFVFLLYYKNLNSQTIRDSVFNDVILIDDAVINGESYLIDLPIFPSKKTLTIFNNVGFIPTKMFLDKTFLEKQDKIIIITPDWEYYKEIEESDKRTGNHSEPVRQRKLYQIDRTADTIDSLTIVEEYLKTPIKYNFIKLNEKKDKSMVFYKKCINTNSKKQTEIDIEEIIKTYEDERKIKLPGVHKIFPKKSNKYCLTLTTEKLETEQKIVLLKFLNYLNRLESPTNQDKRIFLPCSSTFIKSKPKS